MGTRNEYLLELARLKSIMDKLDSVMNELNDVRREMLIDRKGREEYEYEDTIEDSELDLSDIPEKEVTNA